MRLEKSIMTMWAMQANRNWLLMGVDSTHTDLGSSLMIRLDRKMWDEPAKLTGQIRCFPPKVATIFARLDAKTWVVSRVDPHKQVVRIPVVRGRGARSSTIWGIRTIRSAEILEIYVFSIVLRKCWYRYGSQLVMQATSYWNIILSTKT